MRRTVAAVAVALAASVLSVPPLAGSPASAKPLGGSAPPPVLDPLAPLDEPAQPDELDDAAQAVGGAQGDAAAQAALERATNALAGDAPHTDDSPTLALRDLFVALPRLDTSERKQAHGLLARPTDRGQDPYGDGYTAPSKRRCGPKVCVHWVNRTKDAPPNRRWVSRSLRMMQHVWAEEVDRLGYRRPVGDRGRGGNGKLDVYLKNVGSEGYYGYCVPERRKPGHRWVASGYCVLDNDFARKQFDAKPGRSLRITAAHEFFHAVQFAYDYAEDGWLMESSAVWVEERVADGVDDNRQYLRFGQVRRPARSLDLFDREGFSQYGNWVFLEYLSQRFGTSFVRRVWENAAGPARNYSVRAVKRALPDGVGFADVFRAYAAANNTPGRTYSEGASWPAPKIAHTHTLGRDDARPRGRLRVDHLAARTVQLRPGGLRAHGWRLRIRVDGPDRSASPVATLRVFKRTGQVKPKPIDLDGEGTGVREIAFSGRDVRRVTLTLGNASTRFDCWRQELTYSCQGRPRDDDRGFSYRARLVAGD
jgi:Family of unknown function (DUF6055)